MEPTTRYSSTQGSFLTHPAQDIVSYVKTLYTTVFKSFYTTNRHQASYKLKHSTQIPICIYPKQTSPDCFVVARRVCLDNMVTIEEKLFKVEFYLFSNSSLDYVFITKAGKEKNSGSETHFSPETILKSFGIVPGPSDGYTSEQED